MGKRFKKITLSILIGIGIGAIIAGSIFILKIYLQGRFPAKTFISEINLSYKKPEESLKILKEEIKDYLETPIKITLKNHTYKVLPEDLGIEFFPEETIKLIKIIDFNKTNLFKVLFISEGKNLQLLTKINEKTLLKKIEELFALDKVEPKEPVFYFDVNGDMQIKEGASGLSLNKESLLKEISSRAVSLSSKEIILELKHNSPLLTKENVESQRGEIEKQLWHTLTLVDPIYSDDWYITLGDKKDWVTFEVEDKTVNVNVKQKKLNEYVNAEISKWLDVPAEEVKIYKNDKNEVIIEGGGNNGLKIKREELKEKMENALVYKIKEVIIPVEEIAPKITVSEELQKMGIKEVIGIGHSSYYNSPSNRIHNIKTAAAKQNGTLIAPDEVFSFNNNLGPVDGSTGYKKELVIKEEGTVPEFGGGVCQVSTTMYRAALFSGLPIVERNEHSYAVSYYSQVLGHGLDATIYLGGADLRFKNDTGNYILVQAYVKNDYELYFVFYGTSDGREVTMDGPYLSNYRNPGSTVYVDSSDLMVGETKQVEKSHTGFDALWYRYITYPNSEKITEEIYTHYRAIPAKILVGTKMAETSE